MHSPLTNQEQAEVTEQMESPERSSALNKLDPNKSREISEACWIRAGEVLDEQSKQ